MNWIYYPNLTIIHIKSNVLSKYRTLIDAKIEAKR